MQPKTDVYDDVSLTF